MAAFLRQVMESKSRVTEDEEKKKRAAEDEEKKKRAAEDEERKKRAAEDEERKKRAAEDEERKKRAAEDVERKRRAAEDEERKKRAAEDVERKKRAAEDEERKKRAAEDEERKKRAAESEERKKREALEDELRQLKDIASRISKMVDQQNSGTMVSSDGLLVAKKYKLAPQEVAEDEYIASDPLLQSFSNSVQKCWNQSFIAASVIGTSQLSLVQNSGTVTALSILSQLASSLPFASIIFSGAGAVISSINDAHKEVQFSNLAALVPTSDAVEIGILASAIARHFTLTYHDEIKGSKYNKSNDDYFTNMKEMFVKAIDKVDSNLARKLTCKDGLDWLAADMSRICMSYIFKCNVRELSQILDELDRDRSSLTRKLVDIVKSTYLISKPMVVSINSSQQKSAATGNTTYNIVTPLYLLIHKHCHYYIGQVDNNVKYADSEEVRKLKEANKRQDEEVKKVRKVAEDAKSVVDAFIDTTGIGANGQVQAAIRTADGKIRVTVDNPIADEKLAAIAQVTDDHDEKLSDHSEKINRLIEENERLRQQVMKNSSSKGCCTIN